jgi:SAM-dependent methyltransferase
MVDYRQLAKDYILSDQLVKAVFRGRRRGYEVRWRQVTIRPVLIRGQRHLQFSYLDEKKDITKNLIDGFEARIDELLDMPFASINVRTENDALQIQITRKGKPIVHQHEIGGQIKPSLGHDRHKQLILSADEPDPFLKAVGIMTREGKVRASRRAKFRQINEFLRLVSASGSWEAEGEPLTIIDCGCGNAYLTFAVYHYFNHILGRPARVLGLDVNQALIETQMQRVKALGWADLEFRACSIIDYQPERSPDIVLALHACDTATDEALAQAVKWASQMIFAVPCCHHHLQQQLSDSQPSAFRPVLRHGILRERLGDVLTDALRAQILSIVGYRTDVIQFVSREHTDKNLLIRAVKSRHAAGEWAARDLALLRDFWSVEPYLARLLRQELTAAGLTPGNDGDGQDEGVA